MLQVLVALHAADAVGSCVEKKVDGGVVVDVGGAAVLDCTPAPSTDDCGEAQHCHQCAKTRTLVGRVVAPCQMMGWRIVAVAVVPKQNSQLHCWVMTKMNRVATART